MANSTLIGAEGSERESKEKPGNHNDTQRRKPKRPQAQSQETRTIRRGANVPRSENESRKSKGPPANKQNKMQRRARKLGSPARTKPEAGTNQNCDASPKQERKAIRRGTYCTAKPKTNEAETKNQKPTRPPVNKSKKICSQETRENQEPPRIHIAAG